MVKSQGTKQREQRTLGDCWQGKANGQCSKGDDCSFRHDINKRAKTTQPNPSPSSSTRRMKEKRREPQVPEESVRVVERLDGPARITSKELAPIHSVRSGILQNACSTSPRSGCRFGEKCEQNTLTRHIFSCLRACLMMSHTILAQGVSARHTIHVSCACVFDLSSTLSSHSSFVSPIFYFILLIFNFIFCVDRFGAKTPCALPRMRSLALWSTTPVSHMKTAAKDGKLHTGRLQQTRPWQRRHRSLRARQGADVRGAREDQGRRGREASKHSAEVHASQERQTDITERRIRK